MTYALQSRKFHMKHEFFIAPAVLPLDAFEKGLAANISYTYHFNNAWALELPQVVFVHNIDTGLKKDLLRFQAVIDEEDIDSVKYFGTVNVVLKPLYRKMILFNRKILHGETYFLLGGGPMRFDSGTKKAMDIGFGFRIFLNQWASLRFEGRDYVWFNGFSPNNILFFSIGLSMNLGSSNLTPS